MLVLPKPKWFQSVSTVKVLWALVVPAVALTMCAPGVADAGTVKVVANAPPASVEVVATGEPSKLTVTPVVTAKPVPVILTTAEGWPTAGFSLSFAVAAWALVAARAATASTMPTGTISFAIPRMSLPLSHVPVERVYGTRRA